MKTSSTLAQLAFAFISFFLVTAPLSASEPSTKMTPFTMLLNPLRNGIRLEQQRIDYDLTKETVLRIGPYLLDESSVSMQVSRETGEFYSVDFGLEMTRQVGPLYIVSFKWPIDYMTSGVIEIVDDRAQSLWRRNLSKEDLTEWANMLAEQNNRELFERRRAEKEKELLEEKSKLTIEQIRQKLQLAHPQQLSQMHQKTSFGLAHRSFFEIPIMQLTTPFRFCLSEDVTDSRLALCSRRYNFVREANRYRLMAVGETVQPRVLINDKPVTNKGTAIFLQNDIPIKFAAVLKNGTYFEFVSHPKEISIVDISQTDNKKNIEIIGFGETPMGTDGTETFADTVYEGLLNFMPTIGDLRKYWHVSIPAEAPYVYLKGVGGAPFRQAFNYNQLPPENARTMIAPSTTKSTYKSHVWVHGQVNPEMKLSADDTEVVRDSPTDFSWYFPAPEKGVYNTGVLNVNDGKNTWHSQYDIYRGFAAEMSARLSGVVTQDLTVIMLGELAGQYWFENIFGWENYKYSSQRWGVAVKYFQAFSGLDQNSKIADTANMRAIETGNFDLKYRLTPGIWGRDPTLGVIASTEVITYGFELNSNKTTNVIYRVPLAGGGVFWARSMPKIFDDFFNIVPFMRYPKWVDWEFIWYPVTLRANQKSDFIFNMNFHGKIQWTKRFFGEAGFGLKDFSFEDTTSSDVNKHLRAGLVIAYGTVGLGFNF